jgi:threonine/homoserine/homoserine lactone efflux protein
MLEGVARSFAFGATLAAAVGPIAVLILNYGIRSGLRQAVAAGFGAALADFTYALTAFSIGSILLGRLTRYEQALRVVSALILVALGTWVAARAVRSVHNRLDLQASDDVSRPLLTTFMLTMVNPLTIVFFTTFATQLPVRSSTTAAVAFALSLFLGSLMIQMVFAAGGATLSRYISRPASIRAINVASGVAIAAFGLAGLFENVA